MRSISTFLNVCERLFDELAKELLMDRFIIVSASYDAKNGRRIRRRKAHLRKRER